MIEGGRPLKGTVWINGSKNAALPILFATLLTDDPCVIDNVPSLRDIATTVQLLEHLGKRVVRDGHSMRIESARPLGTWAPYAIVRQMRASFLAAGPLLARFHKVRVAMPGGCAIGQRPVDIHLEGFKRMGAKIAYQEGDVMLTAPRLKTVSVPLRFPSVGATQNLMMAAAATPGTTIIRNAAREPENADLADFLNKMGARVSGAGTATVRVEGVRRLRGAEHRVIPDRIEAGTFLIACAASGGELRLVGARADHLRAVIRALARAGSKIRTETDALVIRGSGRPRPVSIRTEPHPGFPTDLQAPWLAMMCLAKGRTRVQEKLFEKRFLHAAELRRMGAWVRVEGEDAVVEGVPYLEGAPIMASDIRAGAALVVAGLAAHGTTAIQRVYHIDRGYERIEEKLRSVGARIRRVHNLKSLRLK